MEYIEYPKSLYRDGQELVVYAKEDDEAALKDGWTDWNTDHNRSNGEVAEVSSGDDKPKRKYNRRNEAE